MTVNGDATIEPNETFVVNLSNPVGATLEDGQGRATITNDDVNPALCQAGNQAFTYTGGAQSFVGANHSDEGAGEGVGRGRRRERAPSGGGGGFASARREVAPGESLTVVVGAGGGAGQTAGGDAGGTAGAARAE